MRKFLVPIIFFSSIAVFGDSPLSRYPKYKEYYSPSQASVEDFYDAMIKNFEQGKMKKALSEAKAISELFPNSPFAAEAAYYKGIIYYKLGDYYQSNLALTGYLNHFDHLKFFYEALQYKFNIAQEYTLGVKKHLLGAKTLPRWLSAKQDALEIYDEIISALPRDEMCAQSLFGKAKLLEEYEDYKESIEVFQTLIRRFPKHPLAAQSFIKIAYVYLNQSSKLFPDPDFIDLAQINIQKFQTAFPGDPRIEETKKCLEKMKTIFSKELFEMAQYYKKKKKFEAAKVYYRTILTYYADSKYAQSASECLTDLER